MDKLKPTVFIASSKEGLDVAYAVQENLEHVAEVTVWPQGIFELSEYTLDDLIKQLDIFDFGIFVFSFEDLSRIRDDVVKITRDNVLFELGLFIGRLGRQRCFTLMPKCREKLHIPTDLLGIRPGIYDPNRSDRNLLAALGPVSNQMARVINRLGLRKREEELPSNLAQQVAEAGLSAFYKSRKDYAKYRKEGSTVDLYIAAASHSLHMVSINLMTGIPFDDICCVLRSKLGQNSTFSVLISLLNPWKNELMVALSPVLDTDSKRLAESIRISVSKLVELKQALPKRAQKRFEIRVHNAIPFGSAIIIDGYTEKGKIQIETKPYKVPIGRSLAFEISNRQGNNELFITLRDAYIRLIKEGETYESILKLLGREH